MNTKTKRDFRIGTHEPAPGYRLWQIVEVTYKVDGTPKTYSNGCVLKNEQSLCDLKWTNSSIQDAFVKPPLDLDNWPNEYQTGQQQQSGWVDRYSVAE